MANYYATARSNYFKVKNGTDFEAWVESRSLKTCWKDGEYVAIFPSDYEEAGWPSYVYDDDTGEDDEFDLTDELSTHLADGEVAVLMEVGHEKLRYVTGHAVAVHSDGRSVWLSLSDIYEKAKEAFGVRPTDAFY